MYIMFCAQKRAVGQLQNCSGSNGRKNNWICMDSGYACCKLFTHPESAEPEAVRSRSLRKLCQTYLHELTSYEQAYICSWPWFPLHSIKTCTTSLAILTPPTPSSCKEPVQHESSTSEIPRVPLLLRSIPRVVHNEILSFPPAVADGSCCHLLNMTPEFQCCSDH